MRNQISRRGFLVSGLAAPWFLDRNVVGEEKPRVKAGKTLDLHIHLFGISDGKSGCRMSKKIQNGFHFKSLVRRLGLRPGRINDDYVLKLAKDLQASGLDKGLILAQDAVYDARGKPDWARTHFYVPNDYLFRIVKRYPKKMLPCVSINPDRGDALAELDRCVEKGARVLKIHPPTQGVDVSDKKHIPFFRKCAQCRVIVMVHTGHEHAAPVLNIGLASPLKLELALDQGCTVVACHCGSGFPRDKPDMLPDFLQMIRKHKNLWGDTAVLASLGRTRDFFRLLNDKLASDRLLHGSDFPFPCWPILFRNKIGSKAYKRIRSLKSEIDKDFELKDALGIGRKSAERGYRLVVPQCPDPAKGPAGEDPGHRSPSWPRRSSRRRRSRRRCPRRPR